MPPLAPPVIVRPAMTIGPAGLRLKTCGAWPALTVMASAPGPAMVRPLKTRSLPEGARPGVVEVRHLTGDPACLERFEGGAAPVGRSAPAACASGSRLAGEP